MPTSTRREDTAQAAAFIRQRLLATRNILIAAGLLLFGFAAFGALSFAEAFIGFAVLAGTALIRSEHVAWKAPLVPLAEPSTPRTAPLLDALIAGLRAPEVVDAIRRVASGAGPQRVEFSERVPVDRWYAAHVMPVEIAEGEAGSLSKFTLLSFDDLTPLRRVEEMRADFVANA